MGVNTIWVLMSVTGLSAACALIGCYMMLFKQSLTTDAVSHATLPGVAIGFFVAFYFGLNDGRYLPLLLLGAAATGGLCACSISFIVNKTRLTEDTAIASTLSVFFGLGILLLSIIQNMNEGHRSGIDSFLLGQISSLTLPDMLLTLGISLLIAMTTLIFHKSFLLHSFDRDFGFLSVGRHKTQALLSFLILIIVCAGLKTAGAILILAMLIIPPATARLWSDNINAIIILSISLGVIGSLIGAFSSIYISNMPAGSAIVVCNAAIFAISLVLNIASTKSWIP